MAYEGPYAGEVSLRDWALSYLRPRNLALGIHAFVAFYVGFKFLFLVFNATDILERWVFELTPALVLGLPELQLGLLSSSVAGANVFLHYARPRKARVLGMLLTVVMVGSLILALRTSPYYFDTVNVARLGVLGTLLLTVPLDQTGLARREERWEVPAYEPEAGSWGPSEPEAFDEAMASVDEALGFLDTAEETPASREEVADLATSLLEELLTVFEEESEVEEEPPTPDPAEVRRRQALFENRIQSIDQRLAANPEDADALFAKGTYLAMQRRHLEAVQALDQVTRINPRYPGVWFLKAKVHQTLGNARMAELCLQRAAEADAEP